MKHRFRLLVERRLVFWFAGLYCLMHVLAWLPIADWWSGIPWRFFRFLLIGFAVAVYGALRVFRTHPHANPSHRLWLAHSSWRWGKPLPVGPIHLVWEDLVVLAVPSCLLFLDAAPSDAVRLVPALGMAFFVTYLVVLLCATVVASVWAPPVICLFLIPLSFYPLCSLVGAFAVMVAIYLVLLWGVRLTLEDFPFNEAEWQSTPTERHLKQAISNGTIGWPYNMIGPRSNTPGISLGTTVVVGALAAWWVHVTIGKFAESWGEVADALVGPEYLGFRFMGGLAMFCLVAALVRAAIYINGFRPPISFFGRLLTGRWIIPRYDVILVAPICTYAFGVFGPTALRHAGVPDSALLAVCVFLFCLIVLGIGPSLATWCHTGRHRIFKGVSLSLNQQAQLQHRERMSTTLTITRR